MSSELEKVLRVVCASLEESKTVSKTIVTMCRVLLLKKETLEKAAISPVLIEELMLLKEWYMNWKSTVESTQKEVSEVLTEEVWESFLLEKSQEENEREEEERVK